MKILIIEDQQELSESIHDYLSQKNFTCEMAYDYYTAIEKVHLDDYACIILDINLPHGNGRNVLKELKSNNKADGVLIISARNSLDDKVLGLNLGADDYLTKPFQMPELAARVDHPSEVIRRPEPESSQKTPSGRLPGLYRSG